MSSNDKPLKFRPERPILLSKENTGYKTDDALEIGVESLRARRWLCRVCGPKESIRPLHMSFNDVKEFSEFKRDCKDLGVVLKEPTIKSEDIDQDPVDLPAQSVQGADEKETYEGTDGKTHIVK